MKVKVFTFQKEEKDILEDWIVYHSQIFGRENIFVIDHSSRDDSVDMVKSHGVDIKVVDCEFKYKQYKLNKLMKMKGGDADILLPLDVDEFVAVETGSGCSIDKKDIFQEFKKCKSVNTIYGFQVFDSLPDPHEVKDPLCELTRFTPNRFNLPKVFFPAKTFEATTQGNHNGTLTVESDKKNTKLCLFHYGDRGLDHFVRKHMRWNEAYGKDYSFGNGHNWRWTYFDIERTNSVKCLYDTHLKKRTDDPIAFMGLKVWKDNCRNDTRILGDKLGTNEGPLWASNP